MPESEAVERNRESAEVGHERSLARNQGEGVTGQEPTTAAEVDRTEKAAPPVPIPAQTMREPMEARAFREGAVLNWAGGNHLMTPSGEAPSAPLSRVIPVTHQAGVSGACGVDEIVSHTNSGRRR